MVTRRQILLSAASAAVLPCTVLAAREEPSQAVRWIVIDPRNSLARESARGFQAALRRTGERFEVSDSVPTFRAELIVLPFATTLSQQQASRLCRQLAAGCSVVVESGASFASHGEVLRQRAVWRQAFGIHADLPPSGRTWPAGDPTNYVRYHWPADAQIRYFGELLSVSTAGAEGIATYRGRTVGIRKRIGRGELLFLGSPLGPMLAAEDHQAAELAAGIIQHSTSI